MEAPLKKTKINDITVYDVSGQRNFASWLPPEKLKALRKNEDYRRRIELIQDLKFETAASRIKVTPDGEYLVVSGTYPPQVKVFELREMSMKFERHLNSEIIDFQILGEDYSKLAFLCSDRSICLHAKFGSYFSTRIPRMGRDLAYDRWTCDLLVAASCSELYRLNLEQGRFLTPLVSQSSGINVIGRSPVHGLIACGGEDGAIECFDLRQKQSVGRIHAAGTTGSEDQEVTALRFDETEGLFLGVGTSTGQVLMYDLRSSKPFQIYDNMYGKPIIDIKWHESLSTSSRHMISADRQGVKIWNPNNGSTMANIDSPIGLINGRVNDGGINDICLFRNSGLLLMALDYTQLPAYFVPALGPAPKWCSYLENITEELEEGGQTTIYDDFKFVTKEDLERLNLTNLIGTNLLHASCHGFFIDYRLYTKAKALADPFSYEKYRQQRIKEKLDAERVSRITVKRKLPKVNREIAARLLADDVDDGGLDNKKKKKKKMDSSVLTDPRFAALFTNPDFTVDVESAEYLAMHPHGEKKPSLLDEHFDLVDGSEKSASERGESDAEDLSSAEERLPNSKRQKKAKREVPRLYEVKDEIHAAAFQNKVSLAEERSRPLEERASADNESKYSGIRKGKWGSRELSYMPKSRENENTNFHKNKKRSVQSLGLKSDKPHQSKRFRGRGVRGRR